MSTPIVSADQLCAAVETTLKEHLDDFVAALGWTDRLGQIKTWQQLPVTDAIAAAKLPAIAITSPGVTDAPIVTRAGIKATWGIALGIYARGRDHEDTQAKVRDWCAALRMTLLANKSLGGVAQACEWVGETFELFPARENARTFGAGVVSLDFTVEHPPASTILTSGALPLVTTTPTTLSVQ